ncbi:MULTISPECIES: MarR family winged helix-turn-helix transcriptional regulator [Sphingobacterium]|jgi:DNA-binding MarR family transcriptional regulator|uniref:MarR family transcriptional regulator n=2 Tax=Sphingobacterium TaxID=28453 RepID=A0ACD5C5D4_9SPHI|nr:MULTISPECIES: MarR family transcriptional regulator [Sphingobacterium]HAE66204.1 MarR family transcriptional regulator [Sphingobacterium sp.]MDF2851539.1 MarR family transcriptional regulator [Sphingobacterium multivorum]OJZ07436.1 MAG: MarR family transcriptional regulator [Sphingobacterium sp. 40-24]QQT45301.1 MarR family transcriptional regulator [Sphingobacterium multivorum]QQT62061.1 MarR family transcriptional regulator [Sphingobacterium multivorum]
MNAINTILNIVKVQSVITKKFDGLSLHGLSLTDFMILHILSQVPGNRLRRIDLAESTGLTASGITRIISPMEKMGLVVKEHNDRDARVSYVKLTAAGDRILKEATVTAEHIANKLLDGMAVTDLLIFAAQLKSLGGDL